MTYSGKTHEFDVLQERARGTAHPPVIMTMPFKPDQGILPVGLLLEASASGLVPYTTGTIAGINDTEIDTSRTDAGLVIVHGSVLTEVLKVGASNPAEPDETTLAALISMGVYPE